jgi:hypothetical protein
VIRVLRLWGFASRAPIFCNAHVDLPGAGSSS